MANILLIYPQPEEIKDWRFGFSLNLLYLSSILKNSGHNVYYKDYSAEKMDLDILCNTLSFIDVVIIEFDSFPLKRTLNILCGEFLCGLVKKDFTNVKVIAFGYDCILFPRHIENTDYTFTVEPEISINHVVDALLKGESFQYYKGKCEVLENIDDLPFPDRSILPLYIEHGGTVDKKPYLAKSTLLQTSRGCLNSCTFCQRKGWWKDYREHSVKYVLDEFRIINKNNYVNVWITDDNFTFRLKRAKDLLKRLNDEELTYGMKLALSSWVNIDFAFLEIARSANVSLISFGIESASREILDFYKKNNDIQRIKELITYADSLGIYTVGNFIIGAPMETDETINDTFAYIMTVPFDQINIKILDYMAGSDLYNNLPKELTRNKRHIFACDENGLNNFSLEYLKNRIKMFKSEFNKNNQMRLMKKMKKVGLPYQIRS